MGYDTGALALRLTAGGLLAGHGAQKLFGAFEGPGLQGTAGFMEAMGLTPGKHWGLSAALSEFGGGTLTALGLFYPLGPIAMISSMSMATAKAHWGKPIWVTSGGAELPVTNIGIALALAFSGPGRYSLDRALGIRVPRLLAAAAALTAVGAVAYGIMQRPAPAPAAAPQASATPTGDAASAAPPVDDSGKMAEDQEAPAPSAVQS